MEIFLAFGFNQIHKQSARKAEQHKNEMKITIRSMNSVITINNNP